MGQSLRSGVNEQREKYQGSHSHLKALNRDNIYDYDKSKLDHQDRSSMLRLCDATRSSKNWAKSMHWWRPQDTTDNSVRNLVRRPWVQNVFVIQVKLTSVIPVVPLLLQFWSVLSIWPNMDSQNNPLVLLLLFLCICVEVPYLPVAKVSKYQTWTLTSENEEHAHTDAHFSSHLLSRWVSPYNHAGMMSWLNKCCFPLSV